MAKFVITNNNFEISGYGELPDEGISEFKKVKIIKAFTDKNFQDFKKNSELDISSFEELYSYAKKIGDSIE